MRHAAHHTLLALAAGALAACGDGGGPSAGQQATADAALRVINGDVMPVTVIVDGQTVIPELAPGTISPALAVPSGARRVQLRNGVDAVSSVDVAATPTDTPTVAARQLAGRTQALVLQDTGRIVPPNASKLRVVHLAAGSPSLDIWRTQPDWQTPITIQFPHPYGVASPYVQSAPGAWEVRASRGSGLPDGRPVAGGWERALAALRVTIPAGQRRTVAVLDAPGGGVRLQVVEDP
jgi:hypothetical protein